jgi:erythrocyte band 7 integral membrane protein
LPCIESYTKVDMRTVSFDVPPQEVLTKDSVTVAVDAVGKFFLDNKTTQILIHFISDTVNYFT